MSLCSGLPSSTPVRALGLAMNFEQWLPMTVTASHTPGRMLLRPPEKPAKKCGSMKPSETRRSVSTATRSMTRSAPEGNTPIFTFESASNASWMTMRSESTMSSPSFARSSSTEVGRWKPVATSSVISISGLPSRSSASMKGMMCLLGTGRVWSLMMIVHVALPAASSLSDVP